MRSRKRSREDGPETGFDPRFSRRKRATVRLEIQAALGQNHAASGLSRQGLYWSWRRDSNVPLLPKQIWAVYGNLLKSSDSHRPGQHFAEMQVSWKAQSTAN